MSAVTQEMIDNSIESVEYHHHDKKVTVCFLKTKQDFYVTGISGVVDRTKFDAKIGEKYALENAKNKLWELFGFAVATQKYVKEN